VTIVADVKSIVFTNQVWDIPYIAKASTSEYVDLKTQPERIDEIPELGDEAALKPLLQLLNGSGGQFITHACAVAARPPGVLGSTVISVPPESWNAPHWYTSYVGFSFWCFDENRQEHYESIYESFPDVENGSICFEMQPVYFLTPDEQRRGMKWSKSNGIGCVLWTSGWGDNAEEARGRWFDSIRGSRTFFASLKPYDSRRGRTVSQHMFS